VKTWSDEEIDNLYYVCSIIEFVGRKTKNRNSDVVKSLGKEGLSHQLEFADVNHCLSFDEVGDEIIADYGISMGNFDSVGDCEYEVPTETSIGGVYRDLILDVLKTDDSKETVGVMIEVFTSFISDEISDFNASTFYENPSYIYHSYLAGELLE